MITYLYWFGVFAVVAAALWVGAGVLKKPLAGVVVGALVLLCGSVAYYFHYQQIFVKNWGGVMHITVADGQRHIGVTWKEDHLWVENFDPASNSCVFQEYSRGDLLQGRVVIQNCSPMLPPP